MISGPCALRIASPHTEIVTEDPRPQEELSRAEDTSAEEQAVSDQEAHSGAFEPSMCAIPMATATPRTAARTTGISANDLRPIKTYSRITAYLRIMLRALDPALLSRMCRYRRGQRVHMLSSASC